MGVINIYYVKRADGALPTKDDMEFTIERLSQKKVIPGDTFNTGSGDIVVFMVPTTIDIDSEDEVEVISELPSFSLATAAKIKLMLYTAPSGSNLVLPFGIRVWSPREGSA